MPDSGQNSGSFYDQIKAFIPSVIGAVGGALAGGGPGALAGAGGGAEAEVGLQQQDAARQEKLLSLMSLMEQRKQNEQYRQESLQMRADQNQAMNQFHQDSLAERHQQNQTNDAIRRAQLSESQARDQESAALREQGNQLRQEDIDLRATIAGRRDSSDDRMNAAAQILSATSGGKMSAAETGMALNHAGLSATGAMFVANRALELAKAGKPVDVDALMSEASKTKDQYGSVLDNVASAMTDPKAEGAKLLGAGAYSNYLISKAKLGTLPPAERAAAEAKIKKFAAASIPPTGDAAKGWKEPTYDDLSALLSPTAPDAETTKPATTATETAPAGAAPKKTDSSASALPKGLPAGATDNGDGTWTLPNGMRVKPKS